MEMTQPGHTANSVPCEPWLSRLHTTHSIARGTLQVQPLEKCT